MPTLVPHCLVSSPCRTLYLASDRAAVALMTLVFAGCYVSSPTLAQSRGDERRPWTEMDYGPTLTMSVEVATDNIAYKGICVRLDRGEGGIAAGKSFAVFDTDTLRYAAAWQSERFINWEAINFNGEHGVHPRTVGENVFTNPVGPGWARPGDGSWADSRVTGRDGKQYGPVDRHWARYRGMYQHGQDVVFHYTVGETKVLDKPGFETAELPLITRTLNLAERSNDLTLQVAHAEPGQVELRPSDAGQIAVLSSAPAMTTYVGLAPGSDGQWIATDNGRLRLQIPAGDATAVKIIFAAVKGPTEAVDFSNVLARSPAAENLERYCQGGSSRWPETVTTEADQIGNAEQPYVAEAITAPHDNPYDSWMRLGGFDFFADGRRAAVCTWQGDVWLVDGLGGEFEQFSWKRIASGLFQPLGLKIVDETVYVLGRDQITILRDLTGDGETDYYENFNNDAQVTEHFHEFAVDLQTDEQGNFYYGKCARHALDAIVPQHGTLLKVAADGSSTEILARGFRAANGVCLNPDGSFYLTDQEGHWTPKNRLNRVVPGGFYGNMMAYHEPRPASDFEPPVCWIHNNFDRSPAAQIWVESDRWGPLEGQLLSTSYGVGQISLALVEQVGDVYQGGLVRMPIPDFPTGIMRGRFNPLDGQFYCCGLFGWSSNKTAPGGFYRVRYTGGPLHMPTGLQATQDGLVLQFSDPVDPVSAGDWANYAASRWQYRRTEEYGSDDYRISNPQREGRDRVQIEEAIVADDRKSVFLRMPEIQPAMQMELQYRILAVDGTEISRTVHHTIHRLGDVRPSWATKGEPVEPSEERVQTSRLDAGLVLTIETRPRQDELQDLRTIRLPAFYIPADEPPTPLLPAGPFDAELRGYLLLDLGGERTFHLQGHGEAALKVNDRLLMKGAGDLAKIPPATARVRGGANLLHIEYRSPDAGDAELRVLWSAGGKPGAEGAFPPEPLPPERLRHDPEDQDLLRATRRRRGRELFASHQCHRCHLPETVSNANGSMPELAFNPPKLIDAAKRFRRPWLFHWMQSPRSIRHDASMPQVLPADRYDAEEIALDIVAFLSESERPATNDRSQSAPPPADRELLERGEVIYEDLGCIACHRFTEPSDVDETDRVSLYYADAKYRTGALVDFLQAPHAYHAARPMPDFRLNDSDAQQLAAFIRANSQGRLEPRDWSEGNARRGRRAFVEHGCRDCHAVDRDGMRRDEPVLSLADWRASDGLGCLSATPHSEHPRYGFDPAAINALIDFLENAPSSLGSSTRAETSSRLVKTLRCTACHSRDGESNDLAGLILEEGVQGLPPQRIPSLTYTGEKLKKAWMHSFIEGDRSVDARPWLRARMPGFGPYAAALAEGLPAEHGYSGEPRPAPAANPELAEIGHTLTLQNKGYFCIECHAAGDAQPVTAFERHRGIDFSQVVDRLQYDYYMRWLKAPKRIDPMTSMPEFAGQPKPNILEGDIDQQFEALWHYLNELDSRRDRAEPPPLSSRR